MDRVRSSLAVPTCVGFAGEQLPDQQQRQSENGFDACKGP